MPLSPEEHEEVGVRAKRMIDDLKWFHEQGIRVLVFARKGTLTIKLAPLHRAKPKKGGA